MRLLIVDDEKMIRMGIVTILKKANFKNIEMDEARDGEDALRKVHEKHYDLIISDIKMTNMNGIELLQVVSRLASRPDFIIISGYGEFEYAQEAIKYGVKAYLLKPINKQELIEIVGNSYQAWQSVQENLYKAHLKNNFQNANIGMVSEVQHNMTDVYEAQIHQIKLLNQYTHTGKTKEAMDICTELLGQYTLEDYTLPNFQLIFEQISHEVILPILQGLPEKYGDIKIQYEALVAYNASDSLREYMDLLLCFVEEISKKINTIKQEKIKFDKMDRAVKYIETNYVNKDLNMAMVSNEVSLNYSYFSQLFKEIMGVNFVEYLNDYRVQKAKDRLTHTMLKIYEISYSIGYHDVKRFQRVFKEKEGMSPVTYRMKYNYEHGRD